MYLNKEHIIVMPTFNDWESLNLLLQNINDQIKVLNIEVKILIINDGSSQKTKIEKRKFKRIKKIILLNLNKNYGNQFAIATGLKYLKKKCKNSTIIVMDSDGEDDPNKLNILLKKLKKNPNKFIVASRSKRTENFLLRLLNNFRLFLTFILTGKYLNFGNFSCFSGKKLEEIVNKKELFLAYCSTLMSSNSIVKVPIKKSNRYRGNSKVNLNFLILYSLKILSVFKLNVLYRSIILIIIFQILKMNYLDLSFVFNFFSFLIILLNIFLYYLYTLQKNIMSHKKFIDKENKIK